MNNTILMNESEGMMFINFPKEFTDDDFKELAIFMKNKEDAKIYRDVAMGIYAEDRLPDGYRTKNGDFIIEHESIKHYLHYVQYLVIGNHFDKNKDKSKHKFKAV